MDAINSSGSTNQPIDKKLNFAGTHKGSGIKGSVADRDWPYEPEDPDKRDKKDKPNMDFAPSDEHSNAIVNTSKKI